MNEIERGWPRWGRLQGSDLSTVPSGTLLIHPISNARAFPGRNAGSGCLRKQKVPPFPPSRQGNKDDPPRKESIGEERRRIDLSPPSTLLEIRPRDLSLRGNCIRITSCHSRYHIQPSLLRENYWENCSGSRFLATRLSARWIASLSGFFLATCRGPRVDRAGDERYYYRECGTFVCIRGKRDCA